MNSNLAKIYRDLFTFCKAKHFAGYDPFDGLNSRIFSLTPLRNFRATRFIFQQTIKRSPINLRPILKVDEGVNPKTIALFALGELSRFRATEEIANAENARQLFEILLLQKISLPASAKETAKSAFGYNFDWQSRAFFAARGTPAIVPTAFAARAFVEGFELLNDVRYRDVAVEICSFILEDLNRSFESAEEICFSYTPLDRSAIFNASLLAGETIAAVGKIINKESYLEIAIKSACFVLRHQNKNGSWNYGVERSNGWVDNFHTAFVLSSLLRISRLVPQFRNEIVSALKTGIDYWLGNFFLQNGAPKYFDKKLFPIDIHSSASAIAVLSELGDFDSRALPQAEKILKWTIENMRDAQDGFFYYRKMRFRTIRTQFMRWSQAWMAFAIARFLENDSSK